MKNSNWFLIQLLSEWNNIVRPLGRIFEFELLFNKFIHLLLNYVVNPEFSCTNNFPFYYTLTNASKIYVHAECRELNEQTLKSKINWIIFIFFLNFPRWVENMKIHFNNFLTLIKVEGYSLLYESKFIEFSREFLSYPSFYPRFFSTELFSSLKTDVSLSSVIT